MKHLILASAFVCMLSGVSYANDKCGSERMAFWEARDAALKAADVAVRLNQQVRDGQTELKDLLAQAVATSRELEKKYEEAKAKYEACVQR
jgi:uncharacterized protein YfiM (DUF2279 family)